MMRSTIKSLRAKLTLIAVVSAATVLIESHMGSAAAQSADEPKGSLTVLVPTLGGEKWFNPTTDVPEVTAMMPMHESLLYRDIQSGAVVSPDGRLAETWSMSPDARTYTFHLRQGVVFHGDWGELSAEDVKFTIEKATSEGSKNGAVGYLSETVESIETPDRYTVVLRLKKPSLGLTNYLTEILPNLGIISKKYYEAVGEEANNRTPVATGPYRFASHSLGESITFEAVEGHWRVTPSIKTITIKAVPDAAARLLMLQAGQADIAPISYDQLREVEGAGLKVVGLQNQSLVTVLLTGQYLNPAYDLKDTPPWAVPDKEKAYKVRRALSLLINREEIVQYVLGGRGSVDKATAFGFVPTNIGFDPSGVTDPYDPERARELLREAGYTDPGQLSITIDLAEHPSRPYGAKVLEAVGQMWQAFGIDVKVQKSEWAAFTSANAARQTTAAYVFPSPAYDDAAALLAFYTRSTDRGSWTGESVEMDDLLNTALAAVAPEDVQSTRHDLWKYLYDNIPAIPVAYADLLFAVNPKLEWPAMPGTIAYTVHNYEYMRIED